MARLKRYTEADGGYHGELGFYCEGCREMHYVNDALTIIPDLPADHIWSFNGDFERPTIRNSVLTRIFVFNPLTQKHDIEARRCHSFVTDGNIQFLTDCFHALAGQTLPLPQLKCKRCKPSKKTTKSPRD